MLERNVSFETPTEAIRVFCGFPNATLTQQAFFAQLGETFMPGTPYMLQPIGLAAYLPAVLSAPAPGLPHEFALICYPSQAVWKQAMNQTLRGRVYNQTHGGVYALTQSAAAFPILIDRLPPMAVDPFFLFPSAIDWQAGVTHVVVGAKKDATQSGSDFRTAVRAALLARRDALGAEGVDQAVATVHDAFAVIWLHRPADPVNGLGDFLGGLLDQPVTLRNERVICVNEPPTISIAASQAFNFIFLREAKYFLK